MVIMWNCTIISPEDFTVFLFHILSSVNTTCFWCFWTVVLEETFESPLVCKETKVVNPKGNQSWIFVERTNAEDETQYFGHLMQRNDSLEKTLMLGKTEGRRRRGMAEDEMVGWHHKLNGHEFEEALEVGDGQGSLACCSPWDCRVGCDWATEL